MIELLWVGLGGFVGAVLRYSLSLWAERAYGGPFPVGTLVVNVVGCFLIGVLMAGVERGWVGAEAKLLLGVGLLGALTTFSTFGFETYDLLRQGSPGLAVANLVANGVVGLLAVWAAMLLFRH